MNSVQHNYPMTDKELLVAHQCLKHFNNIIWDDKIWIFYNHKNLTFGSAAAHQSWQVLWKKMYTSNDYNVEFLPIVGADNPRGDAMS
eukprot:4537989-Ditylum_brightwellii.AAC.1